MALGPTIGICAIYRLIQAYMFLYKDLFWILGSPRISVSKCLLVIRTIIIVIIIGKSPQPIGSIAYRSCKYRPTLGPYYNLIVSIETICMVKIFAPYTDAALHDDSETLQQIKYCGLLESNICSTLLSYRCGFSQQQKQAEFQDYCIQLAVRQSFNQKLIATYFLINIPTIIEQRFSVHILAKINAEQYRMFRLKFGNLSTEPNFRATN